ncbi:MAG TPA: CARDB domain-containing protein, partial [Rhodothermales bacterium]
ALLSADPGFTYRVTHRFPAGNPGSRRFQAQGTDADVFIDLDRLEPSASVAVRWYTRSPGGDPPEGIVTRSENSYWIIDIAPLAADYEGAVEFSYEPVPGIGEDADLRLLHRVDASAPWSIVSADVDVNDRVIRLTGTTDFTGEWTLGSVSAANPLSSEPPIAADNPTPSDGNLNAPIRPALSWSDVPSAHRYDLYFWEEGDPEPVSPFRANLTEPRFQHETDLVFGGIYNWRVVAKNINGDTQGAAWSFTVGSVPDLVVTALETPAALTSGQLVEVKWTVSNQGDGGTNAPVWYDEIFVSESPVFDTESAASIGRFRILSFLNPGESYASTQQVALPEGIQGTHYVHIQTDAPELTRDRLDESDEGNNGASSEMQVTLAPFADLRVTGVIVPANVFSGDSVDVQWTVENAGNGRTSSDTWFDSIFLSDDETFDFNFTVSESTIRVNEQFLGRVARNGTLEPGESYSASNRIRLPDDKIGSGWVFVYSDIEGDAKQAVKGQVYEFNVELNNWAGDSFESTLTPPPDLIVTEVQGPPAAQSGERIDLSWTVLNQGPGATRVSTWVDIVYLSPTAAFDSATAVVLGSFSHSGGLAVDASYQGSGRVWIPDGVQGDAYLFVAADGKGSVFEHTFTSNNLGGSSDASVITRAPYPDLQISNVTVAPTQAGAGRQVAVTYTIENSGTAPTPPNWTDSVYVSQSAQWDPSGAVSVLGYDNRASMPAGDSHTRTVVITLPAAADGVQYVFVKADARERIFEYPDVAPNEGRSDAILVDAYPPVDLAIQFDGAPSSAATGMSVIITVTVTNVGTARTIAGNWIDRLFMSTNSTLDPTTDGVLVQSLRESVLDGGASYTRRLEVELPDQISGEVFLIAVADVNGDVSEVDKENNIVVIPISIALTDPADLRATAIDAPPAIQARQPVTVSWTVENEGIGPTRSNAGNGGWYDNVFLSFDRILDRQDALLGTKERLGGLIAGESYSNSLRVMVPAYASGGYYFVVQTDQRDDVYEHEAEGDNLSFSRVDLTLPEPSDLIVSGIETPAGAVPGEPITVSWTVENIGDNPAQGIMRDGVFVSKDQVWDLDDAMLAVAEREIDIAPGASLAAMAKVDLGQTWQIGADGEVTEVLPGVAPGSYYVIVRTDLGNTIRETDDTNNAAASSNTVEADVPVLTPGVAETIALTSARAQYYRLDVAEGSDVRLTVASDVPGSSNELYVTLGETPVAGGEADFEASDPFKSDQTLVIPSTGAGTHYVLVHARHVPGEGSVENVTVLAEVLGFEVTTVSHDVVGQGQVTLTLSGGG